MSVASKAVNLTIARALLEQVDTAAKREFTTRSDIIRQALVQYLRATRADNEEDPKDQLDRLRKQQLKAHLNNVTKGKI